MPFIRERSITSPPSQTANPALWWPPPRTARQGARLREAHRGYHIGAAGAAHDHCRVAVDHPVPDPPGLIVIWLAGQNQVAAQAGAKVVQRGGARGCDLKSL
jgi:hypothetical protein